MPSNPAKIAPPDPQELLDRSCWSCRLLSGSVLMGSGVWVFLGSRRYMQRRISPRIWDAIPLLFAAGFLAAAGDLGCLEMLGVILFGAVALSVASSQLNSCLFSWGVIIIADPFGRTKRKEE